MSEAKLPAIPQPTEDVKALLRTCLALKEAVEVLAGQRGSGGAGAGSGSTVTDAALMKSAVAACGSYEELRDKIIAGHG